ncbi:MAG: replication initiation protein [Candidatus Wallbacteria bacterium]|nr:replication initiation protein [Candidatus Wallbacteria bacterium]
MKVKLSVIANKPSAMIQTNAGGLSLTQRKLVNSLIHVVQKEGDKPKYCFPTALLKTWCGITRRGNDDLKEQLRGLMNIVLEFNYLNKDNKKVWEAGVLLSVAKIEENSLLTEFEFSSMLKDRILHPDMYTPLDVVVISGMKCKYSIALYELLKDYLNSPTFPKLTLKQFRDLMGVEKHMYRAFRDLKRNVIDKAVQEINEKTELSCSFRFSREGGKHYKYITFTVGKKDISALEPRPAGLLPLEDKHELPEDIMEIIPGKYHIPAIIEQLKQYCDSGHDTDYITSNFIYATNNCRENFPAYLKLSLKNDYARAEREIKAAESAAAVAKSAQAEHDLERENKVREELMRAVKALPQEQYDQLRRRAVDDLKKSPIPSLRKKADDESAIHAWMVDLYGQQV